MASRKGRPNKYGAQVKENIVAVFNRLGGTAQMAKWAKDNETDFYRMYAALAPKEIDATVTHRDESDLSDGQLADIAAGRSDGIVETAQGESEPSPVH